MTRHRPDHPTNLRSLEKRIDNLARAEGRPVRRVQRAVANTIVGQLLPPGVVKGGTAMKLRIGEASSRFTPDLDAARSSSLALDDYLDQLAERLATGWNRFTGTLEAQAPAEPEAVPGDYVMQPFAIRLAYLGRHWLTVQFELGRDEIGSTRHRDLQIAKDHVAMFHTLGLDTPAPIPLLALDHQIAQKLHACTGTNRTGKNDRAHDLVDLQLLEQEETIDHAAIATTAERLFIARRAQPWPPTVVVYDSWDTIYTEAADGLNVISNVTDAAAWANDFITRTVTAAKYRTRPRRRVR
jgi:hypothetical protein